jgi:tyrosine-protein phosphatase SIW14
MKIRMLWCWLTLLISASVLPAGEKPQPRPADWAQPVTNSGLGNFFKVSDELYRSEQVEAEEIPELQKLGIRTILNLRHYHKDSKHLEAAGFRLIHYPLKAGSVSAAELKEILRQLREAPKPVLVHCWHGSDRTGFVVAGYRLDFQKWPKAKAIEELRHGGYGYHAKTYPNVIRTLEQLDLSWLGN